MAALNQSCCGCSLKTGTKIIGIFYMIASLLQVGITAIGLHWNNSHTVHDDTRFLHDENLQVYVDITGEGSSYSNTLGSLLRQLKVGKTTLLLCLVFGIMQAVSTILLFLAVSKSTPVLLLPWITVQSLVTITMTVVSVVTCARAFYTSELSHYPVVGVAYICVMVNVYILLVVSSYYQALCEGTRRST